MKTTVSSPRLCGGWFGAPLSPVLVVIVIVATLPTALPTAAAAADAVRLGVGDRVIDFDLPIVGSDDYLQLEKEIDHGVVVVVVLRGYPGYQCPICNQQLGQLINRASTLAQLAHRVIVVYPGDSDLLARHANDFVGSRRIPDPLVVVRDPGMKMVTQWGLRWDAPRETAYPAAYVIKKNRRVGWAKVSTSHAGRSTADEIIGELRRLK